VRGCAAFFTAMPAFCYSLAANIAPYFTLSFSALEPSQSTNVAFAEGAIKKQLALVRGCAAYLLFARLRRKLHRNAMPSLFYMSSIIGLRNLSNSIEI
jgi:hypothetical protein